MVLSSQHTTANAHEKSKADALYKKVHTELSSSSNHMLTKKKFGDIASHVPPYAPVQIEHSFSRIKLEKVEC